MNQSPPVRGTCDVSAQTHTVSSPYHCVSGARKHDKDHRNGAEKVKCVDFLSASNINHCMKQAKPLRAEELTLLLHARDQLMNYPTQLMTDAELFVQCMTEPQSRDFRFVAGRPSNKFICYMGNNGEPVFYLEQTNESWAQVRSQVPGQTAATYPAAATSESDDSGVKKAAIETAGSVVKGFGQTIWKTLTE